MRCPSIIAALTFTCCTFISCAAVPESPSLIGKALILETDKVQHYDFAHTHEVRSTVHRDSSHAVATYYQFTPSSAEFYEEVRITFNSQPAPDGYTYTRWQLHFTAPDRGTATLIGKHHRALRTKKLGYTVPFRTEALPVFTPSSRKLSSDRTR